VCALGAFIIWGVLPIYFKMLQHINPLEFLAERIFWSFLLLSALLLFLRGNDEIKRVISDKKLLFALFVTGFLVGGNWLTYIIAISSNRIAEASLGYFINPLVSILLGIFFLKERASFLEKIAICIAGFAILFEVIKLGQIPYISLTLAITFGIYGLIRKKVRVSSFAGLFIETSLLLPIALAYIIYLAVFSLPTISLSQDIVLIALSGPVTVVPLLLFTSAAARINLSTLGFIQYLAPSLTFSLAIFVYNEPIPSQRVITFALIWLSLVLVIIDTIIRSKKRKNS